MGHAYRMVPLVRAYLADGWQIIVAARHVPHVKGALAPFLEQNGHRLGVVQAPIFLHHQPRVAGQPRSLADIFARTGFADAQLCRPVVRAWRRLLAEVRPNVVLSDFSPSLNVASSGRYPRLVIGNGWTLPPEGDLPSFDGHVGDGVTHETCVRIVEALRVASDGHWQESTFSASLRGEANFVCTMPQLDPYNRHRAEGHYWPVEIPAPPACRNDARHVMAVYMPGDHPALPLIEEIAQQVPWQILAYSGSVARSPAAGLSYSPEPLDLPSVLPRACIAVHHGGLGMANWCMLHQVPQVIFPTDMEKLLIGKGVQQARMGILAHAGVPSNSLLNIMRTIAQRPLPVPDKNGLKTGSDNETLNVLLKVSAQFAMISGKEL